MRCAHPALDSSVETCDREAQGQVAEAQLSFSLHPVWTVRRLMPMRSEDGSAQA